MRSRFASSATRAIRAASSASRTDGKALVTAAFCSRNSELSKLLHTSSRSERFGPKWMTGAFLLPVTVLMAQDLTLDVTEAEQTFIAIKPDGVQRGLISDIISRFERKGYKLVAIKMLVPTKEFAEQHYDDLKTRPFFNGLCEFLSSGPVVAMVWEGQGVIRYGRKLIGATNPQSSDPGTIRGDLAISVARNIVHGSDGPETAKAEIALWFKPEELLNYATVAEKVLYES
eukprot:c29488_g1_i1 orf=120-809(+)